MMCLIERVTTIIFIISLESKQGWTTTSYEVKKNVLNHTYALITPLVFYLARPLPHKKVAERDTITLTGMNFAIQYEFG